MVRTKVHKLCRIRFFATKTILVHLSVFALWNLKSNKLPWYNSFWLALLVGMAGNCPIFVPLSDKNRRLPFYLELPDKVRFL